MLKIALLIIVPGLAQCAVAAELFGIQLKSSTLDQLRVAVKEAGASVILESNDTQPYDIFDSTGILPGSSRLYIGHAGQNRQTAFVEYEFPGLKQASMLELLSAKYGSPAVRKAKFVSDNRYSWEVNGIAITLWCDWQNYRTLLSYVVPEVLSQLNNVSKDAPVDSTLY